MILKKDVGLSLLLLAVSLVISFSVNAVSPNGIPLFGQWDPEQGVIMAGSNIPVDREVIQINDPLRAKRMVESGDYVVVDVRWQEAYVEGHIPGAVNFPLDDLWNDEQSVLKLVKPEDNILAYCAGVTCSDSHTFAEHLMEMGFLHVSVYAGGFSEWQEMSFDVATGGGQANE